MSDLRRDFPAFDRASGGSTPTAYLDSAATSQRPRQVLDAEREYLEHHLAPVHRGASAAVGHSTTLFEDARATVARFVGAGEREIVWTENATDAINMVSLGIADASAGLGGASARSLALEPGDEIVITEAEHHANLIPWQRLAAKTGARLRAVRVDGHGLWSIDDLAAELGDRTRIVAVAEVSNVTGYLAPVADVVSLAHARGARVVLDACQSVPHRPTDFGAMGVDFAAFSGHKMLGPNGIGVLYGREELLDVLPPARTGGSTITRVTLETAEFLPSPHRFEAGTQPVSQAVALAEAVRYLEAIGMDAIARHESELAARIVEGVSALPGVRIIGPGVGVERAGLVAVSVDGVHAHDVGQFLDEAGIIVRVGHHCAQPLHRALGITASTRASAHVYTTDDEVDRFVDALAGVRGFFGVSDAPAAAVIA
ncbi:aminotransferase class V-fold PLP-dependent enzyme [Agromyces humatus]|uniref:Cysteine desulfurase n=1 Tax=Agromyces humatus TaxID=279573 RepID=A0ABP4X798_9MICO|nr:SufS family cysteine desulfurase [Agromyces humatus]